MTTSIIIPVFNEEAYLPLVLESIVSQTVAPNEVVICDNASTDRSVEIALSFQDRLPLVLLTEKEKGIKPTLEKMWRNARYDILLRIDADSVLPPYWIQKVLSHFDADPQLTALSGPWIPADGHLVHRVLPTTVSYFGAYINQLIQGYPLLMGCNSAMKRTAVAEVGGYHHDLDDYVIDDQLITRKLKDAGFTLKWFKDCWVYHSTRRFQHNPLEYVYTLTSNFIPAFYHEKKR